MSGVRDVPHDPRGGGCVRPRAVRCSNASFAGSTAGWSRSPAPATCSDELYPGDYEFVPCGTSILPSTRGAPVSHGRPPRRLLALRPSRLPRAMRAARCARCCALSPRTGRPDWTGWSSPSTRPSATAGLRAPSPASCAREWTWCGSSRSEELGPVYEGAAVSPSCPSWAASGSVSSIADAAVCGCPVVGPDLPPVRDYLGSAGAGSGSAGLTGRHPSAPSSLPTTSRLARPTAVQTALRPATGTGRTDLALA